MRKTWQRFELTDLTAKVVTYEAFVEGKLEAPKHLARTVHDLYFEPKSEDFRPRTIWSLSNAFTSAFKELDPFRNSSLRRNWESFWRVNNTQVEAARRRFLNMLASNSQRNAIYTRFSLEPCRQSVNSL